MADADKIRMAFKEESTYAGGSTPTPPTTGLQIGRLTGESLAQLTDSVESAEIREDRQTSHVVRTQVSAGGAWNFELSIDTFDKFMEGALQSEATFSDSNGNPMVNESFTGAIVASPGTEEFTFTGIGVNAKVGQMFTTSGMDEARNNRTWTVESINGNDSLVVAEKGIMVAEINGGSAKLDLEAGIKNGATLRSYFIEKYFTDLASEVAQYFGMAVDGMTLNVQPGEIVTGAFAFLGQKEVSATSPITDGLLGPTVTDVVNAVDNVLTINMDGQAQRATQISIAIENNLRIRPEISKLGPTDGLGSGKFRLTGVFQQYFATKAIMDDYLNFTDTGFDFTFSDQDGRQMKIEVPRIKFTSGTRVAGGENTDIIADMAWSAFLHEDKKYMLKLTKPDLVPA